MPDPRDLKVGDRVRFIAIPEEWSDPKFWVHEETREFMEAMIKRRFSSRVYEIDEDGRPWINARIKVGDTWHHHGWLIFESTGWRRVMKRDGAQS